jgi:hypothetical protein
MYRSSILRRSRTSLAVESRSVVFKRVSYEKRSNVKAMLNGESVLLKKKKNILCHLRLHSCTFPTDLIKSRDKNYQCTFGSILRFLTCFHKIPK